MSMTSAEFDLFINFVIALLDKPTARDKQGALGRAARAARRYVQRLERACDLVTEDARLATNEEASLRQQVKDLEANLAAKTQLLRTVQKVQFALPKFTAEEIQLFNKLYKHPMSDALEKVIVSYQQRTGVAPAVAEAHVTAEIETRAHNFKDLDTLV